jgi:autotransporter-associated beta strand protein
LTLSDTAGGGTLTLSSAGNTYAGGTTINAGTLEVSGSVAGNVTVNGGVLKLDNTTALASTADLTLPATPSGNVNLNLSGGTQNIGALYFGSTPQATGTWGASGSGAAHISSAFTGNGLLNVTCAGLVQTITPTASSVCANSTGNTASVTITAGATYAWSITGGTISSDPTQPIITYTAGASGTVHLSCIVTSSGGCASPGLQNTPVAISTTIPAQTITPTASSVCANSTGNTASVTSTPGATYAWSIAGGTIPGSSTSQTVTYTAGASGTVTLNCIVSSSVGCASAGGQNTTVTINTCGPVPPAVQITNIVYNAGTATITGTGVVNTANWFLKASPTVNAPLPWTTTITSGGPITVNPFTATDPDAGSVSQRFYYLTNNPN